MITHLALLETRWPKLLTDVSVLLSNTTATCMSEFCGRVAEILVLFTSRGYADCAVCVMCHFHYDLSLYFFHVLQCVLDHIDVSCGNSTGGNSGEKWYIILLALFTGLAMM